MSRSDDHHNEYMALWRAAYGIPEKLMDFSTAHMIAEGYLRKSEKTGHLVLTEEGRRDFQVRREMKGLKPAIIEEE